MTSYLEWKSQVEKRNRRAWAYVIINQLAFPGVGSILGGRRIGYVQAVLMLIGFFPTFGFLSWMVYCAYKVVVGDTTDPEEFTSAYRPYLWIGYSGGSLCLLAWLWALVTSLSMVKQGEAGGQSSVASRQ